MGDTPQSPNVGYRVMIGSPANQDTLLITVLRYTYGPDVAEYLADPHPRGKDYSTGTHYLGPDGEWREYFGYDLIESAVVLPGVLTAAFREAALRWAKP